jgi:DNA-directed RNA polymerase subunit beta'
MNLSYELRHAANNETSKQRKTEALKRLQVVESFRDSNLNRENRPEWMILKSYSSYSTRITSVSAT